MQSFLDAASCRGDDLALHQGIHGSLLTASIKWRIEHRPGFGRTLVAAEDLPAGALVFSESPLVAARETTVGAHTLRGGIPAVAIALMCASPSADGLASLLQQQARTAPTAADLEAICPASVTSDVELRSRLKRRVEGSRSIDDWAVEVLAALKSSPEGMTRDDGSTVAFDLPMVTRCLGVASVNAHGAGNGYEGDHLSRGVLGLLCSMMEHSCDPTTDVSFASESSGSVVSLHTRREVPAGAALSITYVRPELARDERRRILLVQHGFVCRCARCEAADEGPPALSLESFTPTTASELAEELCIPLEMAEEMLRDRESD